MERKVKIVLIIALIIFLGFAFYFAFLKGAIGKLKARNTFFSPDNLVLELKFDRLYDLTYDSSEHNNNVSIHGTQLIGYGCPSGGCLSFDGLNDSLEILPTGILGILTDDGNSWTFSVMFKPSGLPRQNKTGYILFRAGQHEGLAYSEKGWAYSATIWTYNSTANNTNQAVGLSSGAKLEAGKWYHLAMVMDGRNKQAKLYLDGKQVGKTLNITLPIKEYGTAKYYVGGVQKQPYNSYGTIDDVRIYSTALDDIEIADLSEFYFENFQNSSK